MWCLTRRNIEEQLATDFEVYRYYNLKLHMKNGKYINQLPKTYYNGTLKNEFQIKIEHYLTLNEKARRKIKIKVKSRLPYLEEKFKQFRMKK